MPTELIDTRLALPDPAADLPEMISADLNHPQSCHLGAGLLNLLAVLHIDYADL